MEWCLFRFPVLRQPLKCATTFPCGSGGENSSVRNISVSQVDLQGWFEALPPKMGAAETRIYLRSVPCPTAASRLMWRFPKSWGYPQFSSIEK
jgi:hypothetical protein